MLIVEDGTGVANADSFLSLVDARALAANYGLELDADDTKAEVQLRSGYRGLLTYESTLQGSRTHTVQTGIFPRTGVHSNCVAVDGEDIPLDVKLAQLNYSDAINSGYGTNDVNDGMNLKSFNAVQTTYSETYQDGASKKTNATIQGVTNSLYPLTLQGYANSPCGRNAGAGGLTRFEPF
jgi:hypothetical protein